MKNFSVRESSRLLSLFIEHSPIYAYIKEVTSVSSRVLYASENFLDMIGIPGSQMVGKTMDELFPPEFAKKITADDQAVVSGGKVLRDDEDLNGRNYTTIKFPICTNRTTLLAGYTIDITEHKRDEEALRKSQEQFLLAMDSTSDGLWDWDIAADEVYFSPGYFRILGYEPNEFDNKIENWVSLIHPEDKERVVKMNDDCIHQIIPGIHIEYRMRSKDGSWRWILARGKAVQRDANGNALRMIGVHEDITNRKEVNEALIQAKEKAEESDRLKSAFLANMSHEIRTPMNGILGFAELLKNPDLTGKKRKEYIDIIQKSGDRMLNIINDIIDISKIESGQMNIFLSDVNINRLLEDIYLFFKPDAEKKGIKFLCRKSWSDHEAFIQTDREKVYAIITNMVKNALKFTHSGSIEFGYKVVDKSVQFFVKDTGVGIPSGQQICIFERFRQGSESLTRNFEGAGLGLTISKAYVQLLGGRIWLESEEGKGSEFYFSLPCEGKTHASAIINEVYSEGDMEKNHRLKVIIAEDDAASRMLLAELIEGYCSEIVYAQTGLEAVESCRTHPDAQLVFMDIKMPEMGGCEAVRHIRQFNKDVIIIAQTAYALFGDREQFIAAGCNDYIAKPLSRARISEVMSKYFS